MQRHRQSTGAESKTLAKEQEKTRRGPGQESNGSGMPDIIDELVDLGIIKCACGSNGWEFQKCSP